VNTAAPSGFRPDVQALRAVAVTAVVLNHLWPAHLTGGYVGVDVFFVISGFLISSHLDRELAATGRIALVRFYARRVRRLLPAAVLVLVASLVAAYLLLPFPRWAATAQEALAAVLYAENWLLTANSVEYSNLTAPASPVQHYWSLSVEEQFYLCWPLLLLAPARAGGRRALVAGIAVLGTASLAHSVLLTAASPAQAYFSTPARVWEFALGALVAFGARRLVLPRVWANLASLTGLAMITCAAVRFGPSTAFPGHLALVPTVGTALVIVAGLRGDRQWHTPLSSWAPVQFLGGISYSLYLWHWPLIVLAPFVLGAVPDDSRFVVLALAIALAYLTRVLVEDRGRTWAPLAASTRATFTVMTAGMVVVAVAAGGLLWGYDREVRELDLLARATTAGPCHGAAALLPDSGCADPFGPARIVHMGTANEYWRLPPECGEPLREFDVDSLPSTWHCDFTLGAPSPTTVWLVGDSHAQQWVAPMLELADRHHLMLKLAFQGGCPFAEIGFRGYQSTWPDALTRRCTDWTALLAGTIEADRPDYVFTSFFARQEYADDGSGRSQTEQYRDGLTAFWRRWDDVGARVVVLVDPPLNIDVRPADCVVLHRHDPVACAVDRALAQPPDPLTEVARSIRDPRVGVVDLTDRFCDERRCHAVIGGVVVYFDANHLNVEYSRTLAPMIAAAVGLDG
jgi:peptidoglycan/LPS O-acetylase OafA/YrhL